jgi:DNA recombination protein RmuC
MSETAFLVIGILLGGTVAWVLLKGRLEKTYSEKLKDAESKRAASEALVTELKHQVAQKDSELSEVRNNLVNEKQVSAALEAKYQETEKNLKEQKTLLETMKTELSDTFKALSSAALEASSESFLRLASEHLGKIIADTKGKLGEHQAAIDGLIKPLQETLRKYEEQIHAIEVKRKQDYTSLDEQIKMLASTHQQLQKETGNLVSALRKPHIRGRWGEVTLRNVVELAGMSAHCDFTEQVSVSGDSGRLRPDMVVHLPGRRSIVVDSKVSMEALLDSVNATTEEAKKEALKRHTQHVKEQVNRLASKAYWSQFEKSPELVVLFMGESALVSALEVDPTLMEESMSKRVLVATPTTLFALLTAVAYGWRQEQITKNAEVIGALGKELYERVNVWARYINDIGAALGRAIDAYNRAVGSMESRLLPSVRKFKDLGAPASGEIQELKSVEQTPRNLNLIE